MIVERRWPTCISLAMWGWRKFHHHCADAARWGTPGGDRPGSGAVHGPAARVGRGEVDEAGPAISCRHRPLKLVSAFQGWFTIAVAIARVPAFRGLAQGEGAVGLGKSRFGLAGGGRCGVEGLAGGGHREALWVAQARCALSSFRRCAGMAGVVVAAGGAVTGSDSFRVSRTRLRRPLLSQSAPVRAPGRSSPRRR